LVGWGLTALLTICGRPNAQTLVKYVKIHQNKRKCPDFRDRLHDMTQHQTTAL